MPDETRQHAPQALALEQVSAVELAPSVVGVAQWNPLFDQGVERFYHAIAATFRVALL